MKVLFYYLAFLIVCLTVSLFLVDMLKSILHDFSFMQYVASLT